MKPIIAKLLPISLLLILLCAAAFADSDPLSGVTLEDDWMSGTVTACYRADNEQILLVDCPVPKQVLSPEILTVSQRFISKKQIQQALRTAGQRPEGTFVNPRGSTVYTGDWNAEASAALSKEDAAAQAVEIALAYFGALSVDVYPIPRAISRPYDYNAYIEEQTAYYTHRYSDASTFLDREKSNWKRRSKYFPKQSEYTTVVFDLMLGGVRLTPFPSYPAGYSDEPDAWEGFDASASVTVSDSGILVEAACSALEIKSRRPFADFAQYEACASRLTERYSPCIAAENWQDALTAALNGADRYQLPPNSEDAPFQSPSLDAPVVAHAANTVITGVFPCLFAISRDEWAPFWMIETKQEFSDGWRY